MKVRAYFLLFGIFVNAQTFADPKRVNLALKTVLEFHPKDKKRDIKLLDDIQNVITEIRTIIDENGNIKNFRRNSRDETLTGFIQNAINIINTYEDTAIDDLVHILDTEIRKYHYRDCKFSELMANHEIEKFITAKLDSIKSRSTHIKKRKINALSSVLKYEDYDSDVKKIMDYINSLYAPAGDKFRRLLSNLEGYGKSKSSRSNTNLVKIIRNGLRSIIFDHYTNLSVDTRRHLRYRIENFWRLYKNNHPSKENNIAKATPYNTKNSKNIISEAKDLEPDSRKYQKNNNNKINQKLIKTKQSQHKNKVSKKYDLKNEKKRHKNTRKESIDESFDIQEEKTRQSSQNTTLVVQTRDEIKLQGQTGDVDSPSASFNSIEVHKDQLHNTQQFITIVPGKYVQKSTKVTKKPEIIDTLNVTTKTTTNNTIQKKLLWIEQSTGRLPKVVLDKLANKASRSNPDLMRNNLDKYDHKYKKNKNQKRWHRIVNKPDKTRRKGHKLENAKTHEKKYDPQMLIYLERIRDKTNDKIYQQENEKSFRKIYKQAGGNIEPDNDSLFNNMNEEVKLYNTTKGMLRLELKHDNRPIRSTSEPGKTITHLARETATTKKAPALTRSPRSQLDDMVRMKPTHQTSTQSNSSIGLLHVELPLKAYTKINNKWSRKHERYLKKTTKTATSFKEGVTARNIEIIDDKKHKAQTTPYSYLKDSFERQNRGINRANDNTEEGSNVKHKFELKRYVEKSKQLETMSTADDTLKQDTSNMADTAYHETDSISYVTDKDPKIKENDVTHETAVNKTEFSIEDHMDKYAEKNIEDGKKSETGLKSGFEMLSIDNMVIRNLKGVPAKNKTDFIFENVIDEDSKNNENRIEKTKKFNTRSRLNGNNDFKVTQNKLNMAGTAVNKTEHIKKNNYIQDKDSKNNVIPVMRFRSDDTEVTETADNITEYKDSKINIENDKKSETNFTSDINMMPNDFNDKTEKTNTRTADIKVDFIEKENDFKGKESVIDKDHQIYQVEDQTSIIREAPKEKDQVGKDTKQQNIDDVTYFEAKYGEINNQDGETLTKDGENKVIMKDQEAQDFLNNYNSFGTQTPTTSIASTNSSMKGTESTTKASATTVIEAAPTTPKLIAAVSIPVVTSSKAPAVNENKNKMAEILQDNDVFESISAVTPTTL